MRAWSIAAALTAALALAGCSDIFSAIKGEKGDTGEKGAPAHRVRPALPGR